MIWPGQKFCNNDAFTEAKCQFEPRRSQSQFTIITALVLQIILPYQNPVRARGRRAGAAISTPAAALVQSSKSGGPVAGQIRRKAQWPACVRSLYTRLESSMLAGGAARRSRYSCSTTVRLVQFALSNRSYHILLFLFFSLLFLREIFLFSRRMLPLSILLPMSASDWVFRYSISSSSFSGGGSARIMKSSH